MTGSPQATVAPGTTHPDHRHHVVRSHRRRSFAAPRARRFAILVTLLTALASWAGAQGLTVWTTYSGTALTWLQTEASSYEDAFGVQVKVVPHKLGEIKQGTMVASDKGTGADVLVGIPQDQFSALADAGLLADMGSFTTQGYLDDLSRQARSAFRYGGTLYGLPLSVQGPALIVNTRLVPHPPTSYQGLLDTASSLTADGSYGFGFDIGNFYYAYAWIHSWGGAVFGRSSGGELDPSSFALATPQAVAGAEALRALRFVQPKLPSDTSYAAVHALFLAGKLAMTYDGPWAVPSIQAAGIPFDVVAMPPAPDGTPWSGFMNVDGVLVDRYTADPVGAANLAKWLTTVDAQVALARGAGMIPVSQAALARMADDKIITGFGAALANAEAIPNVPGMGAVWGPMDRALAKVLATPDSDVKTALEAAVTALGGR